MLDFSAIGELVEIVGACITDSVKLNSGKEKLDEGNKRAIKEIVWENKPAGLLGPIEGQAIAWCAFAPREDFIKLEKSRVHKRIDDKTKYGLSLASI